MTGPLQVGAVSLWRDFSTRQVPANATEAEVFRDLITADPDANYAGVSEALDHLRTTFGGKPALVVMSLWTFGEGGRTEALVHSASYEFPVFCEVLVNGDEGATWEVRIYHRGGVSFQSRQLVATAAERGTPQYVQLGTDLTSGRRLWTHPQTGHQFLVLICGESNIVLGGGPGPVHGWDTSAITTDPMNAFHVDAVLNPSHTRFGTQAMRDKQMFLSSDRTLITCHDTWDYLGSRAAVRNANARTPCLINGAPAGTEVGLKHCWITTLQVAGGAATQAA